MNCENKKTELGQSKAKELVFYKQHLLVTIFATIITDNLIICTPVWHYSECKIFSKLKIHVHDR